MIRFITFLTILAVSFSASAGQRILISDIDDTLKISHSQNTWDLILSVSKIENIFLGMNTLYAEIERTEPTQFEYVTNTPGAVLASAHSLFLEVHQFPVGKLSFRTNLAEKNFKLRKMREILLKHRPSEVLLIGDNGERDPLLYAQIRKEFPQIQWTVLIHQIYSIRNLHETGAPLLDGQIGFVTVFDAAIVLSQTGWLSSAGLEQVFQLLPSFLLAPQKPSGPAFLPTWVDCSDFQRNFDLANQWGMSLQNSLTKICQTP